VGDSDGPGGQAGSDEDLFQSRTDGQLHFIKETEASTFPVTAPENATPWRTTSPKG